MKKLIALASLMFIAVNIFSQQAKPDTTSQREYFYMGDSSTAEEQNAKNTIVFKNNISKSENYFGLGFSLLGPEVSYTFRRGHFQTDASVSSMFDYISFSFAAFFPKLDIGFNFFPQSTFLNLFIGAFAMTPVAISFSHNALSYQNFIAGTNASLIFKIDDQAEFSITTYAPMITVIEGTPLEFYYVPLMFIAGQICATVNVRYRI